MTKAKKHLLIPFLSTIFLLVFPIINYAQNADSASKTTMQNGIVISDEFKQYIIAASILLMSIICGFIFKKIIVHKLRKLTKRSHWQGTDIILDGLNRAAIPILMVVGIYISIHNLPLEKSVIQILDIISIVIILITITVVAARISAGFVTSYTQKNNGLLPATSLFSNITKVVIYILGGLIILQYIGVSITPMLTALGVGGLAVALALQDTLSNLFSGLNIIASKQIKPGDFIKLDNQEEGLVTDITWRYTTIQAMPNNRIIVPNFKLASAIITNYNLPEEELTISIPVSVSYESDLNFVEKITLEVAKEIQQSAEEAISNYEPVVRFKEFGPSAINLVVVLRAKDFSTQYTLKHYFIKRLHEEYIKNNIVIPYQTLNVMNQSK
ncbi:MAG: mechanosensitive ion channel family protein [Bacteroidota bacterium]